MQKLLIFDSHAFIHRAFHAIKPDLTTKAGISTNAVYGFFSMILSMIKNETPDYCVFAFDSKEKTFRHNMFSQYKATRVKAPDGLYQQIDIIKEGLTAFKANCIAVPGFEADDIIGAVANTAYKNNLQTIIATGDLDALQLVNSQVVVASPSKGIKNIEYYDENKVKERFSITPEQIPDYKAICGDKSDNIPGVRQIGHKQTIKLLIKFSNLENIYKNLDKIDSERLKNLLIQDKDKAFLSKELATIDKNMKIDFDLDKANLQNYDVLRLEEFFKKYECFNLIPKINFLKQQKSKTENIQPSLF